MLDLAIEKDIKKATTLPGAFYNDQAAFEEVREKIFVKTWQYIGDVQNTVRLNESTYPFTLLDGYLNEPLLLTRNKKGSGKEKIVDTNILKAQQRIEKILGLKVNIINKKNNSGKLVIEYKDLEQFDFVSNLLTKH